MLRFHTILLFLITLGWQSTSLKDSCAAPIINFKTYGSSSLPPEFFGWQSVGTAGQDVSVGLAADPLIGSAGTWKLMDASTSISPEYYFGLEQGHPLLSQVAEQGWYFRAKARILSSSNSSPATMGLRVFQAQRAYSVSFDIDSSSNLSANLLGITTPIQLTTGGATESYHLFDLYAGPNSNVVHFRMDGQEIEQWSGLQSSHGPGIVVRWGIAPTTGMGSIAFSEIEFAAGPPPANAPGDFNNDGRVDALDLAALKRNFGSINAKRTDGDSDGDGDVDGSDFLAWQKDYRPPGSGNFSNHNNVPEPASLILLSLTFLMMRFSSRSRPWSIVSNFSRRYR